MSTATLGPTVTPSADAIVSRSTTAHAPLVTDRGSQSSSDLPLWIFTVIALLGAALLSTYVGLLVYWRMRRRWHRFDRRMRRESELTRTNGGEAGGGGAAVVSPSPRRTLTIAGSSSRSDSNSASATGASGAPSRRGWDAWSHAWAGRRPSEASRGNAEVMSASGESTHPGTVSFGSRFHVAQSPDVSVRLGTNSHRNNNNGRSLASSLNGHAFYRGDTREHSELRRFASDGRAAADWSDGSGDQINGSEDPSQWALATAERALVAYEHGRRTQQSHRILTRAHQAAQMVMAEDHWLDEDMSYAFQRLEEPCASSLPSWRLEETGSPAIRERNVRSADSAASHRFEVDVDDSLRQHGWARQKPTSSHGQSRSHWQWRASLTAPDGMDKDSRRDSGVTHLSSIISRRPSSRRSAASARQSRLSSRPVSGDTSSSLVLGVLPPWELDAGETVLPAKRPRRTSHPAATLEWDFSLENRERLAQRGRGDMLPVSDEETDGKELKTGDTKTPDHDESSELEERTSLKPGGLTEEKLSEAISKALSTSEDYRPRASSPQPAMLHL